MAKYGGIGIGIGGGGTSGRRWLRRLLVGGSALAGGSFAAYQLAVPWWHKSGHSDHRQLLSQDEFVAWRLVERRAVSPTTWILRLALPRPEDSLVSACRPGAWEVGEVGGDGVGESPPPPPSPSSPSPSHPAHMLTQRDTFYVDVKDPTMQTMRSFTPLTDPTHACGHLDLLVKGYPWPAAPLAAHLLRLVPGGRGGRGGDDGNGNGDRDNDREGDVVELRGPFPSYRYPVSSSGSSSAGSPSGTDAANPTGSPATSTSTPTPPPATSTSTSTPTTPCDPSSLEEQPRKLFMVGAMRDQEEA